jgi:hypothetical protein
VKRMVRAWLMVPLLLTAFFVGSCADPKKDVTDVVRQYLDDELRQDYKHQHTLIDVESAKQLPLPVGEMPNPFSPKLMTEYKIKGVEVEGATARAQVQATFQMVFSGAAGLPEPHDLTIYLVHQPGEWKIDEIRTRKAALDEVVTAGAGDTWLMLQHQKRQFQGQ